MNIYLIKYIAVDKEGDDKPEEACLVYGENMGAALNNLLTDYVYESEISSITCVKQVSDSVSLKLPDYITNNIDAFVEDLVSENVML